MPARHPERSVTMTHKNRAGDPVISPLSEDELCGLQHHIMHRCACNRWDDPCLIARLLVTIDHLQKPSLLCLVDRMKPNH